MGEGGGRGGGRRPFTVESSSAPEKLRNIAKMRASRVVSDR